MTSNTFQFARMHCTKSGASPRSYSALETCSTSFVPPRPELVRPHLSTAQNQARATTRPYTFAFSFDIYAMFPFQRHGDLCHIVLVLLLNTQAVRGKSGVPTGIDTQDGAAAARD